MLRGFFLCLLGATFACCAAQATQNAAPLRSANKANPQKIWTNEDLETLRGPLQISVIGAIKESKVTVPGSDLIGPRNVSKTYIPPERDPAWYGKQLNRIDSELRNLDQQTQQINSAIQNASTSGSVAMIVDYSDLGVSTDGTLQRLEKKRRELQAKADELEDMARKNDLEPGSLRSAEEHASEVTDEGSTGGESEANCVSVRNTAPQPAVTKDESYWREQFSELYHQLSQAQASLSVLQREWGTLSVQYYPDPARTMREAYTRHAIDEHKQEIDVKKQKIMQLRNRISDLEDALRKSGGDPGWSRL